MIIIFKLLQSIDFCIIIIIILLEKNLNARTGWDTLLYNFAYSESAEKMITPARVDW